MEIKLIFCFFFLFFVLAILQVYALIVNMKLSTSRYNAEEVGYGMSFNFDTGHLEFSLSGPSDSNIILQLLDNFLKSKLYLKLV